MNLLKEILLVATAKVNIDYQRATKHVLMMNADHWLEP